MTYVSANKYILHTRACIRARIFRSSADLHFFFNNSQIANKKRVGVLTPYSYGLFSSVTGSYGKSVFSIIKCSQSEQVVSGGWNSVRPELR
jgi:hypothetical protein